MRKQLVLPALMFLVCSYGWAQGSQPAAQVSTPVSPADSSDLPLASAATLSDDRPPSGAQPLGVGGAPKREVNVSLNGNQSWDSNAGVTAQSTNNWESVSSFGGALQLNFDTEKARTYINYFGNGIVYSDRNPMWTTYQNLGFSQNVKLGRWTLTAGDTVSYSPNSPFGGYGNGLIPASASVNSSIANPQYVPNQSILTPYTASYLNTVLGQVEYGLSRRSSWTASGSYGILRFPNSALYDTNQLVASTGFNHSFTARDTVFVTYNYSDFHYTNFNSDFASQNVQVGFSHRVSGRMSLQVSGGPQFTNATSIGAANKQVQFAGNANLNYRRARSSLVLTYFAGTTGGSGVLTGAQTQSVQFTIANAITRQWTADLSVGYAHNSALVQQQSYNLFYVSPSLRRALTRNLGVSLNYSYQRQTSTMDCSGSVCGTVPRSFVGAGLDYRFRPIRLE